MNDAKTLPGIVKVEFIPAIETVLYPKRILSPGIKTSVIGTFEKLNLVELASCTTTPERTNAGLQYTTKINGSIPEEENAGSKTTAQLMNTFHNYRLTDVYKNQYLIGTNKKPFPEIIFIPTNENSPAGIRVRTFEITWISTLPPIELVAL